MRDIDIHFSNAFPGGRMMWCMFRSVYIDYRPYDVQSMLSVVYMVYCRQMGEKIVNGAE